MPAVVVRAGTVLGALVEARRDPRSGPPRCLLVVRRGDGALWVVDAARVEVRPR
jgi:hypothetical protein